MDKKPAIGAGRCPTGLLAPFVKRRRLSVSITEMARRRDAGARTALIRRRCHCGAWLTAQGDCRACR